MTIKVKPLEFEDGRAESILGRFSVERSPHGVWFVRAPWQNSSAAMKSYKSAFAAIDALQADYEARILSVIEAVDPATIRAEADAIGDLGDDITNFPQATERGLHIKAYAIRERLIALIDKEQDHADFDPAAIRAEALRDKIAAKAREYAEHYPQSSDGRNTFLMFADWVEALALIDKEQDQ